MTEDDPIEESKRALVWPEVMLGILGALIGGILALSLSLNIIPTWLQKALLVALVIIVVILLILILVVVAKPPHKKISYVAFAAAIVLVIAGGYMGWHWITATPTPLPYVTSAIKFTNPADGDTINGVNVTVRGTTQLNVTSQNVWVLVYPQSAPNRFYPQQPVTTEGGGRWECNVYLGTSNPNTVGNYDVYAVIVDTANATSFHNYLDNSNLEHSWPGVSSQPGVISSDHITLTRVQ